jgi:hypothetical protein
LDKVLEFPFPKFQFHEVVDPVEEEDKSVKLVARPVQFCELEKSATMPLKTLI